MARKSDYRTDLLADLRNDLEYASEYLSAAYIDSQDAFLVALRDVAEAIKGLSKVAEQTKLNRENLYRTLSKHGNPTLSTLSGVLEAVGLKITVVAKNAEVAPVTASILTSAQKANAIGVVGDTSRNYLFGWTMTYTGNLAASTPEIVAGNETSAEQAADINVPLYMLAAQTSEKQEAGQI